MSQGFLRCAMPPAPLAQSAGGIKPLKGLLMALAFAFVFVLLAMPATADAASIPLFSTAVDGRPIDFTVKTQLLIIMTLLGLLPMLLLMVTTFARFVIILSLLRQGLGLQQGLPTRILTGMALLLSLLVMKPVGEAVWRDAVQPYDANKLTLTQALNAGEVPLSRFMLAQTNQASLTLIARLAGEEKVSEPMAHSFLVKASAFMLSELKTAFQIGAMLFIPFLVIDLVVASVLMAMGMMMLSPLVVSLPLKILLFVLVDGWALTISTLVSSVQGR